MAIDSDLEKSCMGCSEKIPKLARLCRHCHTPQNWSRYLFQWKEVIVAILAIAPLWGGAYALLVPLIEENTPQLKILDSSCDSDKPIFLLSNRGNVTAIVKTVGLPHKAEQNTADYEYSLQPQTQDPTGWFELPPRSTNPMKFILTVKGAPVPLLKNQPGEQRSVIFEYVDLDGNNYRETSNWPCDIKI